jgi:hypothetical protein
VLWNNPHVDYLLQAFSSCRAGDLDLSFECLTSRAVLQRLRDVQKDDPDLWSKISPRASAQQRDNIDIDGNDEPPFDIETNEDGDDVGIPVHVLTQVGPNHEHIPDGYSVDDSGSLSLCNASEVFEREEDVDGEDDVPVVDTEEVGRGKRRRTANKQYAEFWKH